MNKEKNFVSAVVYVHNAQERVGRFVESLIEVLEKNFYKSEIICVNDFSNDESVQEIKKIAEKASETTISILNMSYFHGLEAAMNAGVDLSIGDFVFEFDSTIQDYDVNQIMRIYFKALEGFDIVNASANKKQKITSSIFYSLFEKTTNLDYKLGTEAFRILSRRVINRISGMNAAMPYRKAVYANCGLKTITLKYDVIKNVETSADRKERKYRSQLAMDALIIFTNAGYKFSVTMTGLMMLIAIFMAVYSIVVYCMSNPVTGWTTTILFLSCAFFGLFAIMTIIIKYLQVLVDLVFKRKRYTFEGIEKLTK